MSHYENMRRGLLLATVTLLLASAGCSSSPVGAKSAPAASVGTTVSPSGSGGSDTTGATGTTGVSGTTGASVTTGGTGIVGSGSGAAGTTASTAARSIGSTVTPPTVRRPVATTTVAPHGLNGSGVTGTVSAGPTCPVQRAGQPCPPRPVVAEIDARDPAGSIVARTTSDAGGGFALALPPGRYYLSVGPGPVAYPRCRPAPVTVEAGRRASVVIGCDTGIR